MVVLVVDAFRNSLRRSRLKIEIANRDRKSGGASPPVPSGRLSRTKMSRKRSAAKLAGCLVKTLP